MDKVLTLVYTVAFVIGIAYGAHAPLLPVFAVEEIGATYFDIGIIGMANYVPYMFAPAFVGLLLDRFNKGIVLSIGIAMATLSVFMLAFANTVLDLALFRAWTGISHAFFWPTAEAIVAIATPPERRVQAISRFTMAWVTGYMAGPLLGAALFQSFGFRTLFEYSSVIMIAAVIAALMLIRHGKQVHAQSYSMTDVLTVVKTNPRISTLVIYYSASFGIVLTILPAYMKENTVNEFFIGILFFIFGIGRLATLPFTHRFAARERGSLVLATLSIAFAMLVAYSLTSLGFFSLSLVMFGFGFSLYFPITLSMIIRNVHKTMVGTSVGAYETIFGIGWAAGPIISGIVAEAFGSDLPYLSMFVIGIILPVLLLRTRQMPPSVDKV